MKTEYTQLELEKGITYMYHHQELLDDDMRAQMRNIVSSIHVDEFMQSSIITDESKEFLKDIIPELKYMAMKKFEKEAQENPHADIDFDSSPVRNRFPKNSVEYELKNARMLDENLMKQNREA